MSGFSLPRELARPAPQGPFARFGLAVSLPCAAGLIAARASLSDIGFVRKEELNHTRPFEYPALARLLYLGERAASRSVLGISIVNVAVMVPVALLVAAVLRRAGADVGIWTTAPLLVLVGQNWDSLTALCIAAALAEWLAGRDRAAGLWLGAGAAFKLVPGVLLVPMLAAGGRRRAVRTVVPAAVVMAASNLPLMLRDRSSWWFPYRYAAERTDLHGTIWAAFGLRGAALNGATTALLVVSLAAVYVAVSRRFVTFESGAALAILAFIASNKVWQPHYVIWALPALAFAGVARRPVRFLEWTSLAWFVVLWRPHAQVHAGAWDWTVGLARLAALVVLVAVVAFGSPGTPRELIVVTDQREDEHAAGLAARAGMEPESPFGSAQACAVRRSIPSSRTRTFR